MTMTMRMMTIFKNKNAPTHGEKGRQKFYVRFSFFPG